MDISYMKMALELASRARGRTSPNPMVGALVVKDGRIIGKGYHKRAGTPHAEIHALEEAGEAARGATLYVTLEPCCHHGRTGPCTAAILRSGVSRTVVAMTDPNPLVSGKGLECLRQGGVQVVSGVLEDEAKILNEVFIKYITTGRPFVVVKAAMSLDGKIATRTGESQWITGESAREYGHRLRDQYDAIMVGIGTVMADNPSLTCRLKDGAGRDPRRIILDSLARTPLNTRILTQNSGAPTIIVTTGGAPADRIRALQEAGAEVLVIPPGAPENGSGVDIGALMDVLGKGEITSILVEGGSRVHGSVMTAGIADKAVWFIAPKVIGGDSAPGPVGGPGTGSLKDAVTLRHIKVSTYGEDLCIEGYIKK